MAHAVPRNGATALLPAVKHAVLWPGISMCMCGGGGGVWGSESLLPLTTRLPRHALCTGFTGQNAAEGLISQWPADCSRY